MHFDYAPLDSRPCGPVRADDSAYSRIQLIDKLLLAIDDRLSMGLCWGSPKFNFQECFFLFEANIGLSEPDKHGCQRGLEGSASQSIDWSEFVDLNFSH